MEEDLPEDYVPLSIILEKILLHHYYLLTKREAFNGTLSDFDQLDTYRMYTLLRWENEAIDKEEEEWAEYERNNQGNGKKRSGKRFNIKDDPGMVDLCDKLTNRELDD